MKSTITQFFFDIRNIFFLFSRFLDVLTGLDPFKLVEAPFCAVAFGSYSEESEKAEEKKAKVPDFSQSHTYFLRFFSYPFSGEEDAVRQGKKTRSDCCAMVRRSKIFFKAEAA